MFSYLTGYVIRKFFKGPLELSSPENYNVHLSVESRSTGNDPLVSIIIPTRDKSYLLEKCIDSVTKQTAYSNFEILVVNNESVEKESTKLFEKLRRQGKTVLDYSGHFNFSAICNFAARTAKGKYLCFLNNDVEVSSSTWLSSMLEHAIQDDVGIVGAVLTYPDGTIQHMGIALGFNGVAGHPNRFQEPDQCVPSNCFEVSGVTFACSLIASDKYWRLGGLDEELPSGFNDVDIAIRAMNDELRNIVCVKAFLVHRESQTRPRALSLKGLGQASKDVLYMLRKHRGRFTERFFTR